MIEKKDKKNKGQRSGLMEDLVRYSEVSFQIVGSLFIFGLIGNLIDTYAETDYVFTVIGFIIGMYSAFLGVKRIINRWFNQREN